MRVALVGCGRWGACLARTLSECAEFELGWVCDPAVKWPGVAWSPGLDGRVCGDVEAVLVATPAGLHLEPTLCALRHGKPVFVEKPFMRSTDEVEQVRSLQRGMPIMVGHLLLFHPAHRSLMDTVRRGLETGSVELHVVRTSPSREGQPRCPWWTLAPHDLAITSQLFGAPRELRVYRDGDRVLAELEWPRARATFAYSTSAREKCRTWKVKGPCGETMLDEVTSVLTSYGNSLTHDFSGANPLQEQLRHFADCVRSGRPPLNGLADAEENVRLLCWGDRQLRVANSRAACAPTDFTLGHS